MPSCPDYLKERGAREHFLYCAGGIKKLAVSTDMHNCKLLSTTATFVLYMI
jgi:hypothetical protein